MKKMLMSCLMVVVTILFGGCSGGEKIEFVKNAKLFEGIETFAEIDKKHSSGEWIEKDNTVKYSLETEIEESFGSDLKVPMYYNAGFTFDEKGEYIKFMSISAKTHRRYNVESFYINCIADNNTHILNQCMVTVPPRGYEDITTEENPRITIDSKEQWKAMTGILRPEDFLGHGEKFIKHTAYSELSETEKLDYVENIYLPIGYYDGSKGLKVKDVVTEVGGDFKYDSNNKLYMLKHKERKHIQQFNGMGEIRIDIDIQMSDNGFMKESNLVGSISMDSGEKYNVTCTLNGSSYKCESVYRNTIGKKKKNREDNANDFIVFWKLINN